MKPFIIATVLVLSVAFSSVSFAELIEDQWREFYKNSVGDRFLYDRQSIEYHQNEEIVTVTIKILSGNEQSAIKEEERDVRIDCQNKTVQKMSSQALFRDGSVHSDSKAGESAKIGFGSPFSSLSELLCKTKVYQYKKP
jgi:hypothetical protein